MIRFFFALLLLLVGCGSRTNKSTIPADIWPITPNNEMAARLIQLDSMSRARIGNTEQTTKEVADIICEDGYDEKATRQMRDSANYFWHEFIRLCNDDRQKDAYELYRAKWSYFMVAVEYSTARYMLHNITASMAFDYFETEDDAWDAVLRDFETDLDVAKIIIQLSDGRNIPQHYNDLAWTLADCYCDASRWDKALEYNEQLVGILSDYYEDSEIAAVLILIHRAGIYKAMGDKAEALRMLRELKEYIEEVLPTSESQVQLQGALIAIDNKLEELQ